MRGDSLGGHGDGVRLDLRVVAEAEEGCAEDLSCLASQGEVAETGSNDRAFQS